MVKKAETKVIQKSKDGFTLIEVMLVLGITGLILLGLLGGTFNSIAHQRYNDSLRNFAEYLSLQYSEVLSPESIGQESTEFNLGNSDQVILGKIIVFGSQADNSDVYSATLVGKVQPLSTKPTSNKTFIEDLISEESSTHIYCGDSKSPSTVSEYTPLWEAQLVKPNTDGGSYKKDQKFKGTIIIARTPNSSTINTIFADKIYNLKEQCQPPDQSGASTELQEDFRQQRLGVATTFEGNKTIGICVESDNSAVTREVRIAANGRNTSAVSTLTEDASKCR